MSTNSRTEVARAEVRFPALLHLFKGDCLLAGGCQLCDEMQGHRGGVLRMATARELWEARREELIAQWSQILEQRNEPGRFFPWFGECLFDGALLPDFDPRWPERVQDRYHMIRSNLYELRSWIEGNQ